MYALKKIINLFTLLILLQFLTFYFMGKRNLIKYLGNNYETFIIHYEDNRYQNFYFKTELSVSKSTIQSYFKMFSDKNLTVCQLDSGCENARHKEEFYIYAIELKKENPFGYNKVVEAEFTDSFAATWESKYVWILCRWVLIKKINTGIS